MAEGLMGTLLGAGNRARKFARGMMSDPRTTLADYFTALNEDAKEHNAQRLRDTETILYNGVMRDDPSYKAARAAAEERALAEAVDMMGGGAAGTVRRTVKNPLRNWYPGVYKSPKELVEDVRPRIAPESPNLKRLFGVTRDDLYELSKRKGNMPGHMPSSAADPKGSYSASQIMIPSNAQRLVDAMGYARKEVPDLYKGMHGWYPMDPVYWRMKELVGPEQALKDYRQFIAASGIESPNMPVPKELDRATAAMYLYNQGRWGDWVRWGGMKEKQGNLLVPPDMRSISGRIGHQRAAESQGKVLSHVDRYGGMNSPKAPPYIDASGVPESGFQTDTMIGDAHIARGLGLADVRPATASAAESFSPSEASVLAPWYRKNVAGQLDMEAVPTQGFQWGLYGPQTGVKTPLGAPKLEIFADRIADSARRWKGGISPEEMRDLVLTRRAYTGSIDPLLLMMMGGAGAAGGLGMMYAKD